MAKKLVYFFGGPKTDGRSDMKDLLGGKGANLAEMARIGLPVPPGFTITTEVCSAYYENDKQYPKGLKKEVESAISRVEKIAGKRFGDPKDPLLLSCRSGARVSMPGMMETVLNIGLNDDSVAGLIEKTGNERFAYDSYRRFVAMYGGVVLGIKPDTEKDPDPFDHLISQLRAEKGARLDTDLGAEDLKNLAARYKDLVFRKTGRQFPSDPEEQLWGAVSAVFESWNIDRAKEYRKHNGYPEDWGTAVNVQAMVFGNMGRNSATGVAFTRDPATGENYFYGEYLINAQGEDVVAGIRTPAPINHQKPLPEGVETTLEDELPELYRELAGYRLTLERHYRDMQDLEFTIQEGKLWMLQCRNGKRTSQAALKIAMDLVREGLISPKEAVSRIQPQQLVQILLPYFDVNSPDYKRRQVLATGLAASPGAAVGTVVFSATDADKLAAELDENGWPKKVILVREETSPEDIRGMFAAQGILTARGGMTSHAAVVARGMGRVCVAGAAKISVNYEKELFTTADGETVRVGDWISLDGTKGEVIKGKLQTAQVDVNADPNFAEFMDFVSGFKKIKVRTNADTPRDSLVARGYQAEGIGLCRTEHMFFEEDRIDHIRAMILAEDVEGRKAALDRLLPMQRSDFYEIFKAMNGLPVTIRTLDPPLHEFLPHSDRDIEELAHKFNLSYAKVKNRVDALKEQNPMLGLRGCRLGILYPEITHMQARAVFEAAAKAAADGVPVEPEIMIPLVGHEKEFILQKAIVDKAAADVSEEKGVKIKYMVGTMIELPRAALQADNIARAGAQFFSFGTNDLTQTTYGLSRDDSGSFLGAYTDLKIWQNDPFVTLDQDGVGQLIKLGVEKGRGVAPKLKVGICGEHGGDPASVMFCCLNGFDYVSCSPHRVPLARLAAAQAAILAEGEKGGGKKSPARRAAPKAQKKPATGRKKAPAKPAARKPALKKPGGRKAAPKKAAAQKAAALRGAAKKAPAKKPGRAAATSRKPAAKRPAAKKPAQAKRAAPKRAAAGKARAAGRRGPR
ncbi:MAG: pyruvate, phosphate dikinase [Deltaproteobacteria bacterium]|jgi:pyruvate,orthophosphate dikinase|nr:pyruvate, phosphate dikinase [Deltaproteobacteria bacterium]